MVFGSCYGGFGKATSYAFNSIVNEVPDLFVWLGDAAYTDVIFDGGVADDEYVKTKFDNTLNNEDY